MTTDYPKFKIMSFNIGGVLSNRGEFFQWEKRALPAALIIEKYAPDIIGFQEVQTGNLSFLKAHFPHYEIYLGEKTCSMNEKLAMYNPIFWNKERFQKLDAGSFYLSETPSVWSKSWDSMEIRGAVWVRLKLLDNGTEIIQINTHLDHKGRDARIRASRLIVHRASAIGGNRNLSCFLTGDFNERAWSPTDENPLSYPPPVDYAVLPPSATIYEIYIQSGFRDAYLEAGRVNTRDMNTYHDCFGENFPPAALRLDWILYRNGNRKISTEDFSIIRDAALPVYPSDHYPVIAEVSLK